MPLHVSMLIDPDAAEIEAALTGLVALNRVQMSRATRSGRPMPALYNTGLVWHREDRGRDDWQSAEQMLSPGAHPTDCEDLACYRAAELQEGGEDAQPYVYQSGERKYHVIVKREDGTYEDPSRITKALARRRQGVV